MCILLVELNPDDVLVDTFLFLDKNKNEFIYEHLRHFYSKPNSVLPTIEVKVGAETVVTRGHLYLLLAKELGYKRIRAVIARASPEIFVDNFLKKSSVEKLDWKTIRKEESEAPLAEYAWYIFFFKRALYLEERKAFEEQIVEFFRQIKLPSWAETTGEKIEDLSYPYGGTCAEFQAYVPIRDERWYAPSRAVLINFHLNCVPIVSFQGRKFRVE